LSKTGDLTRVAGELARRSGAQKIRELAGYTSFLFPGATMNPVGWFEIYVNDLPRATKFYEAVLKKPIAKLDSPAGEIEMMAFPMEMNASGAAGALVKMEGVKAGGNSTIVYFITDDCAVEASRVEAAGGKIMKTKMSIGKYGFIALVFDTEGNVFGLHSMK
jgi:predicted enzyme related to lactoylglutathione lyase